MLKIAVLVSGGGTNLQAIIDSIADGRITDTEIKVVISNNPKAKALERAAKAGIEAVCISPKQYADRELFSDALLEAVKPGCGSHCIGRLYGGCAREDDQSLQKQDDQYPSVVDPVFLWNRLLWTACS